MAVRNGEPFLAAALASIAQQSASPLEVLVVDGNSVDRSREIAVQSGATVLSQSGIGLADAWNSGLSSARGDLIAFLDSDDEWTPNSLAARHTDLLQNDADIVCGRVRHIDISLDTPSYSPLRRAMLVDHMVAIPGTMLVRRQVFDRVGSFHTEFKIAADTDWLARAIAAKVKISAVDEIVLLKRLHKNNLTRNGKTARSELLTAMRRKIAGSRSERH